MFRREVERAAMSGGPNPPSLCTDKGNCGPERGGDWPGVTQQVGLRGRTSGDQQEMSRVHSPPTACPTPRHGLSGLPPIETEH